MILKKLVPIVAAVFFMFAFVGCGGGGGDELAVAHVDDAEAGPPKEGWPPDPPAKPASRHWVFEIQVKKGDVQSNQ